MSLLSQRYSYIRKRWTVQLLNDYNKNKKGEGGCQTTQTGGNEPRRGRRQGGSGRWEVKERGRGVYCLVLSSFSSSMSLREALTLLETSFPCEKRRWRSLKVILSGLPPGIEFSCSWLHGSFPRESKYKHRILLLCHVMQIHPPWKRMKSRTSGRSHLMSYALKQNKQDFVWKAEKSSSLRLCFFLFAERDPIVKMIRFLVHQTKIAQT